PNPYLTSPKEGCRCQMTSLPTNNRTFSRPASASTRGVDSGQKLSHYRGQIEPPAWLPGGILLQLSAEALLDFIGRSVCLASGSAFPLASRGPRGRAARKGQWLPRRDSVPSLMHTDLIDFIVNRTRSMCRYAWSDLLRSCGSLARWNDGPDTARALGP